MRAVVTVAAAALLAACTTVGPDYERPAVDLPRAFPTADADAGAAIAPDWWRLFRDPDLDRLENRALAANFDVAQAVARVEQAEARAREVRGQRLPQLELSGTAGRNRLGADVPTNFAGSAVATTSYISGLSASYEIDFWGRIRRADEAARAALLAGQAARDTVRLTIAALVAQNWFALRSLDEQIAVTRYTLATRERGLRLNRTRLEGGTASRLDVEQAEILRADSAILLRDLQRQRAGVATQLGVLAAEPEAAFGDTAQADGAWALQPPLPPPGLPSTLLERRPDIVQAEQQLASLNAQIGVARAALFPTISLTATLGQQSGELAHLLGTSSTVWSLGFGLAAPIFNGGQLRARVDQAAAAQREAVGSYQGTIATAFKEVADALEDLRAARDSAPDVRLRLDAAERALKLANARFAGGYSSNLDVLDAERTVSSARLDNVRNQQAQLVAGIDLIRALGGGWQPATSTAEAR